MADFSFSCKTQVHFGAGVHRKLLDLLPEGARFVVLVTGVSGTASAPVRALLAEAGLNVTFVVCAGEPTLQAINDARGIDHCDCIVVCGGGSAIDTGKALRVALQKEAALTDDDFGLTHDAAGCVPLIVLPTTAGTGAEVTSNAVLGALNSAAKVSFRGPALQPDVALVDPDLMKTAPQSVVLYAGLDAVVQNIEAYTSAFSTPLTRALAGPAIGSTLAALRDVIETGSSDAWSGLACGSLSSGLALANGGLGAAHGLASVLGGAYPAPHGALCGRLLMPVMRATLQSPFCTEAIRSDIAFCQDAIAQVFAPTEPTDPCSGFERWVDAQDLPRLSSWGVRIDQIEGVAQTAVTASSSLKNSVKLDINELAQVLRDAL